MKILAFDTTSSTLSCALLDGEKTLAKNTIFESGKQSELLIPEIEKLLRSQNIWYKDLNLIAATNGPGSFTGTRIGLTCARTLKLATNLPLVLVNSCEAIAFKYRKQVEGKIFVALDAAMDEFFCAEFFCQNGNLKQVREPQLITLDEVYNFFPKDDFFLCGSAKKLIKTAGKISAEEDILEADLVGFLALEKFKNGEITKDLNPIYLRAPRISVRKK